MQNKARVFLLTWVLGLIAGCSSTDNPGSATANALLLASQQDKPFPNFPLRYEGTGLFQDLEHPREQSLCRYTFDMSLGVNREEVTYVDREILVFNVFDMNPGNGTKPDREYFISKNAQHERDCVANPTPLPNVFSRAFWLSCNMVYQGAETINGFAGECWQGAIPGTTFEVRFCNRIDRYPNYAPLLKKLGPFQFFDHYGRELSAEEALPRSFFKVPKLCRS